MKENLCIFTGDDLTDREKKEALKCTPPFDDRDS